MRVIIILLITGIIAIAVSNALTAYNNERILNDQKAFVTGQAEETRRQVESHSNATKETLQLIKTALLNQSAVTEQFKLHMNQTATAAPIVQELEPIIKQNNELLNRLLNEELNQSRT